MKLLTELADAVGRVVLAVQQGGNDEELVVVFADETFLSFRSCRVCDDTEIEVQSHFDPMGWQFPDLEAAFGNVSAMALHNAEVERREAASRKWKEEKRARLERELRALDGQA